MSAVPAKRINKLLVLETQKTKSEEESNSFLVETDKTDWLDNKIYYSTRCGMLC